MEPIRSEPFFVEPIRSALAAHPAADVEAAGRPAAVLLMLFESGGEPWLVFTKRSQSVRTHKGEISFPGGAQDPGETLDRTAVREAQEELGLDPADVTIVGRMSDMPTFVSGFVVRPFVSWVPAREAYPHSEAEIDEVIQASLPALAKVGREADWTSRGHRFTTNVFEIDGNVIWGATGRILRDFLDIVAEPLGLDWPPPRPAG